MKQITDFKIEKETEKALLIEIDNKTYWFPKSKVEINGNVLEMTEDVYDQNTKAEVKEKLIKINSSVENYSDNSFKIIIRIKKDEYEADKFMFIPKSKVTESEEDFLVLPKWIYNKSLEEILQKECDFFNAKYSESISPDDYEILTETEEI